MYAWNERYKFDSIRLQDRERQNEILAMDGLSQVFSDVDSFSKARQVVLLGRRSEMVLLLWEDGIAAIGPSIERLY